MIRSVNSRRQVFLRRVGLKAVGMERSGQHPQWSTARPAPCARWEGARTGSFRRWTGVGRSAAAGSAPPRPLWSTARAAWASEEFPARAGRPALEAGNSRWPGEGSSKAGGVESSPTNGLSHSEDQCPGRSVPRSDPRAADSDRPRKAEDQLRRPLVGQKLEAHFAKGRSPRVRLRWSWRTAGSRWADRRKDCPRRRSWPTKGRPVSEVVGASARHFFSGGNRRGPHSKEPLQGCRGTTTAIQHQGTPNFFGRSRIWIPIVQGSPSEIGGPASI